MTCNANRALGMAFSGLQPNYATFGTEGFGWASSRWPALQNRVGPSEVIDRFLPRDATWDTNGRQACSRCRLRNLTLTR